MKNEMARLRRVPSACMETCREVILTSSSILSFSHNLVVAGCPHVLGISLISRARHDGNRRSH
jgi:hypothetical protein